LHCVYLIENCGRIFRHKLSL